MKTVNFIDQVEAIPEEDTQNEGRQSTIRNAYDPVTDAKAYKKKSHQTTNVSDLSECTNISSPDNDLSDSSTSREERARLARERFETLRQQRLDQLSEAKRQAEAYREEQLMLKKKRRDESRARDEERRKNVEERKKKLQEIEQVRRDAIQRKLERIDRSNESRRYNGGPSGARIFGFGSCTPRDICTPIRRSTLASLQPPTQQGWKHRKDGMPSRTVLSTPDVNWLSGRRGSSEWGTRGPRGPGGPPSAHATLMTGSFTVAMSSPSTIGIHHRGRSSPETDGSSLKKAASTTYLAKGTPGSRRANRMVPYPSEKDKLDRTVSTPNIASANQRSRSSRSTGAARSPSRSTESIRRPTGANRTVSERTRPASAMAYHRSDSLPRRSSSSLTATSPSSGASSAFFDRLSQPRRIAVRNEEEPSERKRSLTLPASTSNRTSLKPQPRPQQPMKKLLRPKFGTNDNYHAAKPAVVTFEMDKDEHRMRPFKEDECDKPVRVEVNVEDVEADAMKDRDNESEVESEANSDGDEEDETTSPAENTSAGATPLPSDRSASPPRSLLLNAETAETPAIQVPAVSASPAKSEPEMSRQPAARSRSLKENDNRLGSQHPPTCGLPPPSPPPQFNKGSAPSTPTGQREFPFPRASSTREVTEEEYRLRIAEQRRLARERMAAQEAEKARAREEERRLREEELQRLREAALQQQREMEEEERRLEEEQRRAEEEKRQAAAEEEARQEAERVRKEQEQMAERKQMLERVRLEQLRQEEEGRLQRRRRLESIMSRVKKSTDMSGSRESLTSSHLDLSPSSNGDRSLTPEPDRPLSPAPQFKSALLQSMMSKGRLSTSIRAVSALRRSQGTAGSTGSLLSELQNISRSSENLSSTSNSGPTVPTSSSGELTTSQTEVQLSPPPVVNPCMWRSHPNGIPGLGGHERDAEDHSENYGDEEVDSNPAILVNSIRSRISARQSLGNPSVAQETRRSRPNSVHFEDMIPLPRGGADRGDIVDDESTSSDADLIVQHDAVPNKLINMMS